MMNAIQPLPKNSLPMSPVPHDSLFAILDNLRTEQLRRSNRLTLVIPIYEVVAYYESKLLRDVIAVKQGLILRIATLLASED